MIGYLDRCGVWTKSIDSFIHSIHSIRSLHTYTFTIHHHVGRTRTTDTIQWRHHRRRRNDDNDAAPFFPLHSFIITHHDTLVTTTTLDDTTTGIVELFTATLSSNRYYHPYHRLLLLSSQLGTSGTLPPQSSWFGLYITTWCHLPEWLGTYLVVVATRQPQQRRHNWCRIGAASIHPTTHGHFIPSSSSAEWYNDNGRDGSGHPYRSRGLDTDPVIDPFATNGIGPLSSSFTATLFAATSNNRRSPTTTTTNVTESQLVRRYGSYRDAAAWWWCTGYRWTKWIPCLVTSHFSNATPTSHHQPSLSWESPPTPKVVTRRTQLPQHHLWLWGGDLWSGASLCLGCGGL